MILVTNKVGLFLESELFRSLLMFGISSLLLLAFHNLSIGWFLYSFLFTRGVANLVAVRALFVGRSLIFDCIFPNTISWYGRHATSHNGSSQAHIF